MELIVKNNRFYVLNMGNDKRIYDTEREAIASLKRLVTERKDLDPEDIDILEVTMGEKWEIKSVPWSKIAIELIKGGD